MTAPLATSIALKTPPASPIGTKTRYGNPQGADLEANVILAGDVSVNRTKLLQAMCAAACANNPDATVLVLTINGNFDVTGINRNFVHINSDLSRKSGFVLDWRDGVFVADQADAGTSQVVDIAMLEGLDVGRFEATLLRRINQNNTQNLIIVLDGVEGLLARKRNGKDGVAVAEYRQLASKSFERKVCFLVSVVATDAIAMELNDHTGTYIAGRTGAPAAIAANANQIHIGLKDRQDSFEYDDDNTRVPVGIANSPGNFFWMFNFATSNVRPGYPTLIESDYYSSQPTGIRTTRDYQLNLIDPAVAKDILEAREAMKEADAPEALRRHLPKAVVDKVVRRGRAAPIRAANENAPRGNRKRAHERVIRGKDGISTAAAKLLTACGDTDVFNKVAIARLIMKDQKRTITAESIVDFVAGNEDLALAARQSRRVYSHLSKIVSIRIVGGVFYQALQHDRAQAQPFFDAVAGKGQESKAGHETRVHLVNLKTLTGSAKDMRHYNILRAGWRHHLANAEAADRAIPTASNDNAGAKKSA